METRKAAIDPADWLAKHDPDAAGGDPFPYSHDVFALGADGLAAADGDLSRALAACPDCRAEIILAWLADQGAADGVMLAARIVGRLNAPPRTPEAHQEAG